MKLTRGQRQGRRNAAVRRLKQLWVQKVAYCPETDRFIELRDWPPLGVACTPEE